MELHQFLSLSLSSYLDPSKARLGVKKEYFTLDKIRPSTSAQTIAVLRKENASKQKVINNLISQVDSHEHLNAALPSSLQTLRREYVALEEENDALAGIIIEKENVLANVVEQ
jgi:hypothetical protein